MLRRILALLLTALLCAAALPSLAEGGLTLGDGAALTLEEGLSEADESLALDGLAGVLLTNEGDAQPVKLRFRKSCTMDATLGLSYQIAIPGKKIVTCKSGNAKIATVTKKGLIQTKKAGNVRIVVTPDRGHRLTLKLKITDPNAPTAVTINEGAEGTLNVGETLRLTATVSPAAAPQDVAWASSDSAVATVSADGLVSAIGAGSAAITATTGNKLRATFALTVNRTDGGHYMISHAMGGIDGNNYSNCLEGFQENYAEGHRIFEVDILYTSDGKMVLWHHWDRPFCSKYKKGKVPTYAQFMESKIYDQYTPMDLEDLLKLMAEYPDIRIVTDSKCYKNSDVKKQFRTIVSTAKSLGIPEVLDRFVVEIYTTEMIDAVESVYHFKEYMMTLYKIFDKSPSTSRLKKVLKHCQQKGIKTVAMYADWWKAKFAETVEPYGLEIALYTVNSSRDAQRYFDEGVTALFTDFLPPV